MRKTKQLTIFSLIFLAMLPVVFAGSWSGSVYDTSNNPIDGATVNLVLNSNGNTINSSTTNATGYFTVSGLQDGIYTIQVTRNGFYDSTFNTGIYLNNSDPARTDLVLIPGILDIIMVPNLPGVLSGNVNDINGIIAGATVTVTQNGVTIATDTTDASGDYYIDPIIEGTYILTVNAADHVTQTRTNVVVVPNSTTTLDFTLSISQGDIQGTVTDALNGSNIVSASVIVVGTAHVGISDGTGSYSISDVPVGSYTCRASAAGYYDGTQPCQVTDGGTAIVNFQLTPITAPIGDADGDGIADNVDNCVNTANPGQEDVDGDGVGDVCDNCVNTANAGQADADGDGVGDTCDNCVNTANTNQANFDGDALGDVCDGDIDNDGCANGGDDEPYNPAVCRRHTGGGGGGSGGGSFKVVKTLQFDIENPICGDYSRYEQISFNFKSKAYTLEFETLKISPMILSNSEVAMQFSGASKDEFSMKYNQRKYLDLDKDGRNDLVVKFSGIDAIKNRVNLCFEMLPQQGPKVTEEVTEPEKPEEKPAAEKVKEDVKEVVEDVKEGILNIFGEVTEKKPASAVVGSLIILAIVLPGLLLYFLLFRRRKYY